MLTDTNQEARKMGVGEWVGNVPGIEQYTGCLTATQPTKLQKLNELGYKVLPHPPYSPNLSPTTTSSSILTTFCRESIFCLLLFVDVISLQKVVEMLEEVVVDERSVEYGG